MTAWMRRQFSDREHAQRAMLSLVIGSSSAAIAKMIVGVMLLT